MNREQRFTAGGAGPSGPCALIPRAGDRSLSRSVGRLSRPAARTLAWMIGLLVALAAGPAVADRWLVDRERSRLGFEIVETGNLVGGQFSRWTADIRYDPSAPAAARVRVEVETASAATGEPRRDQLLTGPDWLDSTRISVAVFEAEGFRALGGDRFETSGTLRLRDGVRPITLAFTLTLDGDEARALGRATLVRTQFGIGHGQWAGVIGFDVVVTVDLVARRAR